MKDTTLRVEVYPLPEGHDWLWIEPPAGLPVLLLRDGSATFKAVRLAVSEQLAGD